MQAPILKLSECAFELLNEDETILTSHRQYDRAVVFDSHLFEWQSLYLLSQVVVIRIRPEHLVISSVFSFRNRAFTPRCYKFRRFRSGFSAA